MQSRLRATDYVAVIISAEETGVRCYAGNTELLSVRLAGARRPDLRADDFVQLLRHTVRATRLEIGRLDARDIQGLDFRAFPHVARVYIIGRGAEEILRNLTRGDGDDSSDGGPVAGPSRAQAVCPELKELAVYFGFEFQEEEEEEEEDGVEPAVEEEHRSGIAARFPEWCTQLEGVLSRRAEMGTRLTGLQFGWTESKRGAELDSEVAERTAWTLPSRTSDAWGPWGLVLEPLEKLVDGPVVVDGYRVFSGDDR
ncbi:hypothetical protein V8D89_004329 [Ganoderma adspersum]